MRKLMWLSLGFAAACCIGAYIFPQYFIVHGVAAFAAGIVLAVCTRWIKVLRIPATVLIAFSLGVGWFALYDGSFLSTPRQIDAETIAADIEVTDYPSRTDSGSKVSGKVCLAERKYPVTVYLREPVACKPGDRLHGTFYFRFTAFGGDSEPAYQRSDGVFLLAYPSGDVEHLQSDGIPSRFLPKVIRMELIRRIEMLFPKEAAAFAKALVLGERSGMDYETNTAFKISGISHIVAVSGLHVSILFSIAALLFGRRRLLLFLTGIPLLALFAAVTGFTPSVVRACIMQGLMLTALLINKEYDPPTALAAAATVMLLANPMVSVSISFQLSFACMIGIFLSSDGIYALLTDEKRMGRTNGRGMIPGLKRWLARSVSVSLSASLLTTPLVAVHFGTVSLVSILTNLLVVWLVPYVFYGVILACGIGSLSIFAGRIAAWLTAYPIRFVIGTAKTVASFPLSAVYTESIYIVAWLIFSYLMLAVFLCMKRKPVALLTCLCAVCLCICSVLSWVEPLMDPCRLTVLDVGQGQCMLLQSDGRTFLIDCGGSSDTLAADKAAETLLSQGICRLDGVIVTHYDNDHAGGIPYLLSRIDTDAVYLPQIRDDSGICQRIKEAAGESTVTVAHDLALSFGSTNITIFGPESYELTNDSSLCILFRRENCDILITGDRGSLGEMLLLHRIQLPDVDVLIAGHHGSAGSTGEELLQQTKPEYVFISVGESNRYGHPAKKLLERLAQYGCLIYRTDLHGTIIYRG